MRMLPVEHLGGGPLVALEHVGQVGVVVAHGPPAQHPGEVIARAQGQDAHLTLVLATPVQS